MPGESLSFPITADDRASAKFREVGNAALGAAGKVDLAAKALDLWDDTAVNSRKATDTLIAGQLASAKAFNAVAKAATFAVDQELKASALTSKRVAEFLNGPAKAGPGFFKRTSTWPGLGRELAGLFGGGGGAAGAAGGAQAGGRAAAGIFSNPYSAVGAVAAGLIALPFAAQLAGTGIVTALGAAFTGIAIRGALMHRSVQDSFADLAKQANAHLKVIGAPFVPVMNGIAHAVMALMRTLTPVFVQFAKIVGPPFEAFAKTLIRAFGQPAVKASIIAVGRAFGALLTALAPALPGIIKSVALGITTIANAVAKNPGAFVGFVKLLGSIAGFALQAVAKLILVAVYIEQHFKPAMHRVAVIFDGVRHDIAHIWDQIFQNTIGTVIRFVHNVETQFNSLRHFFASIGHDIASAFDGVRHTVASWGHDIASVFDRIRHFQGQFDAFGKDITFVKHVILAAFDAIRHGGAIAFDALRHAVAASWDWMWHHVMTILDGLRHGIAAAWDAIWRGTTTSVRTGTSGIISWFRGLPGRVIGAMASLGRNLYSFGRSALTAFLNGLKAIAGSVFSWIGNFVTTIWDKVKRFFGMSPPHAGSKFYELGADMMRHLEAGIKSHAHKAAAAAQAVSRRLAGAGPGGGAPSANAALAHRLYASQLTPASWAAWNYVAMRESGWNQFARNPSSGAYGIAQALPATKYPFAGQAAGGSNPMAQITWMWNYMQSRYGGPLGAEAHELAFNWYDKGGWLPRGLSLAYNATGRPEMVVPAHAGSAPQVVVLEVTPGRGSELDQLFATWLRKYVRVRGGNAQLALGRS